MALVVTLNTIQSTLNNLIQGNKREGVLAPPTQAALNGLLVVKSQYNDLFGSYEPAVTSTAAVTAVQAAPFYVSSMFCSLLRKVSLILRLGAIYAGRGLWIPLGSLRQVLKSAAEMLCGTSSSCMSKPPLRRTWPHRCTPLLHCRISALE